MNRLNTPARWSLAALLIGGLIAPRLASAQGKSKSKEPEKHDAKPAKGERHDNDQGGKHDNDDDAHRVKPVRTVVVQPARTVVVQPGTRVMTVKPVQPAHAKHVTTPQALLVTRQVLVLNGYQVVNVVPSGTSQIVYYRRGNMGRGRGLGPVERMTIVPVGQVVQFQSVAPTLPQTLLATILSRLGM